MLGFVAGGVYQQKFCRDTDFRSGNAVSVPVVGLLALTESAEVTDWQQFWSTMVFLVLVNSMGGASLFLVGVRNGGAAAMTTLSSVVPSVTALIAWPLLGRTAARIRSVPARHRHLFEFCRPDGSRRTDDRWVTLIE
ncbi:hypothetical protein C8D88_1011504 [Lentzea atacamensis]|uniref:EamA-like transporter family protein n=1 Tax=Lentzea atacamensis TaxID=531938 RepID=A0A316ICY5_9PSEU|nr:EamA family transporter [Lentzea atacamensis]PWK91467.1 hypothetical protein C8D88_1011504 [Lentzea atacamensis]